MSREVFATVPELDDGPVPDGGSPGPDATPEDVIATPDESGDGERASGLGRRPGRPHGSPGGPARRGLRLPLVAGAVAAAAVLGLLLGGWQARVDAQRSAVAGTRILLWTSNLQGATTQSTVGAADFTATARTFGPTVLLHELRTPYGSVSFGPDVALDPDYGHDLRIRMRPDCSTYSRWQGDWSKAPRTATAMVRDRPRDPLREVPADLTGDLVIALAGLPCEQQGQT